MATRGGVWEPSAVCWQSYVESPSRFAPLGTPERQSLCESHRQRRWLTYWSYRARLTASVRLPLCKLCTAGDLSRADGSRMMSHGRLSSDTDITIGKSWNEKEEIVAQESGDL